MSSGIEKDLFDTCIGEEFECVFDERGIGKREKTLFPQISLVRFFYTQRRFGIYALVAGMLHDTYPWLVASEGLESGLESIGKHNGLKCVLYLLRSILWL
jgi:hypothetical protein